jgi:hypothetical protein
MARKRRVAVGALNIRIHPHPPNAYERLLRTALRLKRAVAYRGDQYLLLSQLAKSPNSLGGLDGSFARFTEIDPSGAWFNTENLEKADEEDVESIVIPAGLKPNFTAFYFTFFPGKHLLVAQTESPDSHLSPRLLNKSLERLFNQSEITKDFGHVEVDLISDSRSLKRLLAIPKLRHLTIEVQRPNADDQQEYEEAFERRLTAQKARRLTERYDAISGESLEPDDETKRLARLAMRHGKVIVEGRDEQNNPVLLSSADFPKLEQHRYDPDLRTEKQAFDTAMKSMLESVKSDTQNT